VLVDMATQRLSGQHAAGATSVLGQTATQRQDEQRGRRGAGYALLAVAVIAVIVLGALLGRSIFGNRVSNVAVPNLSGLSQQVAEQRLTARGLVLGETTQEFSDSVDEGLVIRQNPEADAQVEDGSRVDLVISQGEEKVVVPDVLGDTVEDAQRKLTDAQLEVGKSTERNSDRPKGEVIDSSPNPGTEVAPGTQIDLVVSSGVKDVEVPDVVGKSRADAEAELRQAGFRVEVIYKTDPTANPDTVLSQRPDAGAKGKERDRVSIIVAQAPSPSPTSESPSPTSENTSSPPPSP